jgi:hypothetical protein
MEVKKWPRAVFKGQDEQAVRVQLCFTGKEDHEHYCIKLRIPKAKLHSLSGGRTAADDPEPRD